MFVPCMGFRLLFIRMMKNLRNLSWKRHQLMKC